MTANFPQCGSPSNFSALSWMLKTSAEDVSYWADEEKWDAQSPKNEWDFAYAALLALAED